MDKGLPLAINLAAECKRRGGKVINILGGLQATLTASVILRKYPAIDYIVLNEAEVTLVDLLKKLEDSQPAEKVSGIAFRRDGKVVVNPPRPFIKDLDALPLPDFSLVPALKSYQPDSPGEHIAIVDVGRGCSFHCAYCSTALFWQNQVRQKSPQRLLAEIKYLFNKFKINQFIFNHDQFLIDKDKIRTFCRLMEKSDLPVSWRCYARLNLLDDEYLRLLKRGKCGGVFLGIESASPRILRLCNKKVDFKKARRVITKVVGSQLLCLAAFIIGFPDESVAELDKTLAMALEFRRLGSGVEISLLEPFFGTKMWRKYCGRLVLRRKWLACHYDYLTAQEKKRIAESKIIFSSFYNFKTRELPVDRYYELKRDFFPLIYNLPGTLTCLLRLTGLTPTKFAMRWQKWLKKKGLKGLANNINESGRLLLAFAAEHLGRERGSELAQLFASCQKELRRK
jgi:radical SAM superfamily enzyme YgiQ (UPF0313 family)